jgi:predicted enzyme related to lactoylglutathione lyase
MIQRLSHTAIYCVDQEVALRFYVDTLGFEVIEDERMGPFRWLTVAPKGQPVEIILMQLMPGPMLDEASVASLRTLAEKGAFCAGVLETDDCRRTYEELSAKGVKFTGPPVERPYGLEVLLKDPSGNWFSVVQRPRKAS